MILRPLFLVLALTPVFARAQELDSLFSSERLELIDRPFQGDFITLSPDGRHVAYSRDEEGQLQLVIREVDSGTSRGLVLNDYASASDKPIQLTELRWAGSERLVLVASDREILSVGIDGDSPVLLWGTSDTGLVGATYLRQEPFFIVPGDPRLLPPIADDPTHVLIEGVTKLGTDQLVTPYKVDVTDGSAELVGGDRYLGWQVALYGRGDMVMWPPLPYDVERWIRNPSAPGGSVGNIYNLAKYFDDSIGAFPLVSADPPSETRGKLETFLSFPPQADNLWGWPASPNPSSPSPPDPAALTPESGAAVSQASSSNGRMIYDHDGNPRLLYTESTTEAERHWVLFGGDVKVFEPNRVPPGLSKTLQLDDPDEFEITPRNYFGERSYPLAFDYDPNILYIASNRDRDTFGIYTLDLTTGERTEVLAPDSVFDFAPLEPEYPKSNLIFDDAARRLVGVRFGEGGSNTVWLDTELADVQAALTTEFRYHTVQLVNWSDDRERFLVRASSEEDPGAYFVYDRSDSSLRQVLLRAPWLKDARVHPSSPFAFTSPEGVFLTGHLTVTADAKVAKAPLVIYLQGGIWDRATPGFNREAQLLADFGVTVMRLNVRGTAGQGRAHLTALQQDVDRVPMEDLLAAIEWLSDRYPIDRNRIAIMGEGFGGYLALRALQTEPGVFRAAIAINAPTSLRSWASWRPIVPERSLYRNGASARSNTVEFRSRVRAEFFDNVAQTGDIDPDGLRDLERSILVIESSNSRDTTPILSFLGSLVGFGTRGADLERLTIGGDFVGGSFEDRALAFQRIEEFLNLNLYDFGTQIGNLRVIETDVE